MDEKNRMDNKFYGWRLFSFTNQRIPYVFLGILIQIVQYTIILTISHDEWWCFYTLGEEWDPKDGIERHKGLHYYGYLMSTLGLYPLRRFWSKIYYELDSRVSSNCSLVEIYVAYDL